MGTATEPVAGRLAAEIADEDLVRAVRAGDDAAFASLYRRHQRPITAFAYRMVKDHGRAEDVTQEVFISALRRLRQTDQPVKFRPWIFEITRNACIDQHRRARRAQEVSYDGVAELEAAQPGRFAGGGSEPAAVVDRKQSLDDLCGALRGLNETQHDILVMRELEGRSYSEIGKRLGMSGPAVDSTLFRARKRLAEEYGDLASGARCDSVQAIIAAATGGRLRRRDERRVACHLSHCDPCRRHARRSGVDVAITERRSLRARAAAILPFPFLRRRRDDDAAASGLVGHHTATLAQWSATLSAVAEPATGGWLKATAAVTALALAGAGTAGVVSHRITIPALVPLPAKHAATVGAATGEVGRAPAAGPASSADRSGPRAVAPTRSRGRGRTRSESVAGVAQVRQTEQATDRGTRTVGRQVRASLRDAPTALVRVPWLTVEPRAVAGPQPVPPALRRRQAGPKAVVGPLKGRAPANGPVRQTVPLPKRPAKPPVREPGKPPAKPPVNDPVGSGGVPLSAPVVPPAPAAPRPGTGTSAGPLDALRDTLAGARRR